MGRIKGFFRKHEQEYGNVFLTLKYMGVFLVVCGVLSVFL